MARKEGVIRKEAVAGQFYESNPEKLKEQIKNCFEGRFGPKKLPSISSAKTKGRICGVIVPHAGYEYSGQAAAWAYKEIAESDEPDVFILIGTNHRGTGKSIILSMKDFSTPLGTAKNDTNFSKVLLKELEKANLNCEINENAHLYEHSIEVQLPFLLFSLKQKINFVPIILSNCSEEMCRNIAEAMVNVSKNQSKKILIIASSDFTHYGVYYGFIPFSPRKENLYNLDKEAIGRIIKFDTRYFLEIAGRITICGPSAIAVCMETCKLLGAKKAELLNYYTSGDLSNDYSTSVGYASIAFR